jgi:hypothetical protein
MSVDDRAGADWAKAPARCVSGLLVSFPRIVTRCRLQVADRRTFMGAPTPQMNGSIIAKKSRCCALDVPHRESGARGNSSKRSARSHFFSDYLHQLFSAQHNCTARFFFSIKACFRHALVLAYG